MPNNDRHVQSFLSIILQNNFLSNKMDIIYGNTMKYFLKNGVGLSYFHNISRNMVKEYNLKTNHFIIFHVHHRKLE